jgi:hypothetical protein
MKEKKIMLPCGKCNFEENGGGGFDVRITNEKTLKRLRLFRLLQYK